MIKQDFTEQTLIQYLLGSLPEAEAERLDELSFTDEDFAAALQAAENDLVDAYVRGEVSGQRLEKFKSFYLSSPIRAQRVELARALPILLEKNSMPRTAEEVAAAINTDPPTPANWWRRFMGRATGRSFFVGAFNPLPIGLAMAVVVLGLIFGALLVNSRQQNRELLARLDKQRNESIAENNSLKNRLAELQQRQSGESNEPQPSPQPSPQPPTQRSPTPESADKEGGLRAENEKLKKELAQLSQPQLDLPQIDVDPSGETRGSTGKQSSSVLSVPSSASFFTVNLPGAGRQSQENYLIELIDQKTNRIVWSKQRRGDGESTFTLTLAKRNVPRGQYRVNIFGLNKNQKELLYHYDLQVNYK